MASGIIKSKKGAQDGNVGHNDGTVQDSSDAKIYPFKNQPISSLEVDSGVTFDISTRDSDGNIWAENVRSENNTSNPNLELFN